MNNVSIDTRQLQRLNVSLKRAGIRYGRGTKRLLKEIGLRVVGLAKTYCPESPQKMDYAKMNKSGRTRRSSAGISTGSLRDSITSDADKHKVSIGVPINSKGGKYAEKMHDKKGVEWSERGVRTKQKGRKADDKFIYRAYTDSEDNIDELIDKVIADLTKGIGI